MKPSIGRIVHYRLTEQDAIMINRRRYDGSRSGIARTNSGAQVHFGHQADAGDWLPMIVISVLVEGDESKVRGQVFLAGNDTLWVTVTGEGEHLGGWRWPPRVD